MLLITWMNRSLVTFDSTRSLGGMGQLASPLIALLGSIEDCNQHFQCYDLYIEGRRS